MLPHEALGYNRFGLRYVSKEEIEARRRFVLSYVPEKPDEEQQPFHKPLKSYQDGEKSFSDLIKERHKDEMGRLKERYQDFLKFPQSGQFQKYQIEKGRLEDDYVHQEYWLRQIEPTKRKQNVIFPLTTGILLSSAAIINSCSKSTASSFASSLFCLAALASFYQAYKANESNEAKKTKDERNKRIQMLLEDWHEKDRFARYDRALLNNNLDHLNKKKPTQERRDQKRNLVAQYRLDHPKVRE